MSHAGDLDLLREMVHDGEDGGGVDGLQRCGHVHLDVAEALTVPPIIPVVVVPDEAVEDGDEVHQRYVDYEHHGGELAVAEEQAEWYPAD